MIDMVDGKLIEFIEEEIPKLMRETKTPGLSIAVLREKEVIYAEGFGARNVELNLPATPNTLYGIGSCTKSFTALAIMQLAEKKLLNIDDPVEKYVPLKIKSKGKSITIHNLLTHTSGLPSLGTAVILIARMAGIGEKWIPMSSMDDFYRHLNGAEGEVVDEPGKRFFYFNAGYTILGDIIEKVSGKPYEEYIQENILTPLEMERTTFLKEKFEREEDKMTPYWKSKEGKLIPSKHPFHKLIYAPGGLLSSVMELTNYLKMNIEEGKFRGRVIVKPESIREMQRIYVEMPRKTYYGREGYGYGWGIVENFLGEKMVEHGGSTGVSSAYLAFLPKSRVGVAMASNTSGFPYSIVAQAIFAILLGKDPEKTIPPIRIRRRLNMLAGIYETYKGISRVKVVNRGGILFIERRDEFAEMNIPIIPEDLKLESYKFSIISNGIKTPVEFQVKSPEEIDLIIERNVFHKVRSK